MSTEVFVPNITSVTIRETSLRVIATLGNGAEVALHGTLDGFLSGLDGLEKARLFQLVERMKGEVDKENLPQLADRILDDKLGLLDRVIGLINKKFLAKAAAAAWEETCRLASGKTKTLVDFVNSLERDLEAEQQRLEAEIDRMEQLRDAYRDRFDDFVVTVREMNAFLARSRGEVAQAERSADPSDLAQKASLDELRDKLQALESRTLALEGILNRLPADQLVIRQLQNAGITTLGETTTTAAARFTSIKMTLLTLHSALVTKGVQRLAEQGAQLDTNLAIVRGRMMHDVVGTAANAAGDNRLAQANQLKQITNETRSLVMVVEQARIANAQKFAQVRNLFEESRQIMLGTAKAVRPDQPVSY